MYKLGVVSKKTYSQKKGHIYSIIDESGSELSHLTENQRRPTHVHVQYSKTIAPQVDSSLSLIAGGNFK